jgi:GDSL-like Lipase/Acylhydrolase family
MRRKVFITAGKFLAGIVAASLLIELLFAVILASPLQWILPVPPVALYGPDPDTGYRHRANVVGLWLTEHRTLIETSNLGLRDRNRDLAHSGGPRAVIVGNSFIEALQVDGSETAVAVAERILARERAGAEVVNLGLAGARPAVAVARLQSAGLRFNPDLAVIALYANDLLSPSAMDDSEFTGYRRGSDGAFALSYGFRASSGYRFRTSRAGRIYYWLLDHSQVARIINARKNSGLLAELSKPVLRANASTTGWDCLGELLDAQLALWVEGKPAEANALLDAYISDLAAIRRSHDIPIIVATFGIEARCQSFDSKRIALVEAIRARLQRAGLGFVDLDAQVLARVGREGVARLHGFGANLGSGHLNVEGNRIYGEIFAEVIGTAMSAPQ